MVTLSTNLFVICLHCPGGNGEEGRRGKSIETGQETGPQHQEHIQDPSTKEKYVQSGTTRSGHGQTQDRLTKIPCCFHYQLYELSQGELF